MNVLVRGNVFRIDKVALGCVGTRCGENSIFSNTGARPAWSPYLGDTVKHAITFNQNNRFASNTYIGDWHFDVFSVGQRVDWATWRGAPYNQDVGSTILGDTSAPAPALAQPVSIWPDSQPVTEVSGGQPYTLGTRFTVSETGAVSALRFSQTPNMTGVVSLKLWQAAGPSSAIELASTSYPVVSGQAGWRNAVLGTPVRVVPSERYVVTYHTENRFAFEWLGLQAPRTVGKLTASASDSPVGYGNALYRQEAGTHTFPNGSSNGHSYFADVVFQAGA
jgi:hypothetical protein